MNINYLIQRDHLFKDRKLRIINRPLKLNIGTSGLFSYKIQRFEFVYLRILKKIIRRKYIKRTMRFRYCKFWLFLNPNNILSKKSTNARMGAGVGSYVRLSIKLKSYVSFVEFKNYSSLFLKKIQNITRYRLALKFFLWKKK